LLAHPAEVLADDDLSAELADLVPDIADERGRPWRSDRGSGAAARAARAVLP